MGFFFKMEMDEKREQVNNGDASVAFLSSEELPKNKNSCARIIKNNAICIISILFILVIVLFVALLISILSAKNNDISYTPDEIHTAGNGGTYSTLTSNGDSITNGKDHNTGIAMLSDQVPKAERNHILPNDLEPFSYKVMLIPHFLGNMTTTGNVSLSFNCIRKTKKIILNLRDLEINNSSVIVKSNQEPVQVDSINIDKENEFLIIRLMQYLKPSRSYVLEMSFMGLIKETPRGLYRTTYSLIEKKGFMVSTQFSPNDARSVFPCFDEPIYKARFTFILGRHPDYHSLSNMQIVSTMPEKYETTYFMDTFYETPLMSTYLTAFAITEFESVHPSRHSYTNITFAGHSESADLSQMTYVLTWMEKLTMFFGKYFGIPYPLPKMDIIAVPDHFFTAMENWGFITFRKNMVYVNEKTTEVDKQHTVTTLAHEIAHQWFGNLVTPKWWNNLWLKEGFSTFYSFFAINEEEKNWHMDDNFQLGVLDDALKVDALMTSLPLSKSVSKTSSEIFETVSYNKGASMIRMMSHFLGPENFKKGVMLYLKRFAYSNADQDDLWDVLKEIVDVKYTGDIDVKTVMESWTLQVGYPIVHVSRMENTLIFSQKRLLLNGKVQNDSLWWIPISYTTQTANNFQDAHPKLWLSDQTVNHTENFVNRNDWIIANINQTGFYRVNYDENNWIKLIVNFGSLPNNTKAQLISDSLFLARASLLRYDYALSMALEMTKEMDYLPWKAITNHIFYIGDLINNMPAYGDFRLFVWSLLRRLSEVGYKSGWNYVDPTEQMHSVNILNLACYFDQAECLKNSYDLYQDTITTGQNSIPYFIRHVIYCTAVKYGGQRIWKDVYDRLNVTTEIEERRRLIHALGCAKEFWLVTQALTIINETQLTADEILTLFQSVMSNSVGSHIGINFIRDQWLFILKRYNSPHMVYSMVSHSITFINTPYSVTELKSLVGDIQRETNENSILLQQTVEFAESNIIWMNNNYNTIASFLKLFVEQFHVHSR